MKDLAAIGVGHTSVMTNYFDNKKVDSHMFCKLGNIAGKQAGETANEGAAKSHKEEGEDGHEGLLKAHRRNLQQGLHRVVQHHRHAVVEQRLPEDEEVEALVHMDFL